MTGRHQQLIDDLVGDLTPVTRPGRIGRLTAMWLLAATVYGVAIMLATGPLRPGALSAFASHVSFIAETGLAALAVATLAIATVRSAIPDEVRPLRWLLWFLPVALWVAVYVVELSVWQLLARKSKAELRSDTSGTVP